MSERNEFIGIICDGNRTWAMREFNVLKKEELTATQLNEAYNRATHSIRDIMHVAVRESIGTLALWGLSDKNIVARNEENIGVIVNVLQHFFEDLLHEWIQYSENKDVRIVHMGGSLDRLPNSNGVISTLNDLIEMTKERTGSVIALCLNYDGEVEQADAIHAWSDSDRHGAFRDHLFLPMMTGKSYKPVDAIIRTGVQEGAPFRRGHFLQGYERYETAYLGNPMAMPEYTADHFLDDLALIRTTASKKPGL